MRLERRIRAIEKRLPQHTIEGQALAEWERAQSDPAVTPAELAALRVLIEIILHRDEADALEIGLECVRGRAEREEILALLEEDLPPDKHPSFGLALQAARAKLSGTTS